MTALSAPPIITVKRSFMRPDPTLVARFSGGPTGNVSDAAGRTGTLPPAIKPVTPLAAFAGPALTVHAGPHDNLAVWAALEHLVAGDVMVVATGGYSGAAVVGDLIVAFARNAGAIAVVTDGMVRDREGLAPLGVPVHAAGIRPAGPDKAGPGAVGLPVWIGEHRIEAGDLIVGDTDGVVTVPQARLVDAADALDAIRAKEAVTEAEAAGGARAPSHLAAIMADVTIVEVD